MKLNLSCIGLYFIQTSEIHEASLNVMLHVWLQGGVLVGIVWTRINM